MAVETDRGWFRTFMERGGWWRAVAFTAAYLVLYSGAGLLMSALFGDRIADDMFADTATVFLALFLPLAAGSALLAGTVALLGWSRPLFGRQPVPGRAWMWIAPLIVVLAALLRILGTDYGRYTAGVVAMTYAAGLLIGFAEEVLARGIVIHMLRRRGFGELAVMLLSSLLFALMHATNLLSGQPPATVAATMGFTFAFGVAMYLTLRATRFLIWPVLLHAATDPSTFLATGGIDEAATGGTDPLVALAGASVLLYALLAVAALFLIRDRTDPDALQGRP
ncbi:CPBP family intramembrane glutamic endopeptidase [Glycomyces sp. NPDC048151]|uniref:CPBP family intramembrane glutamic endopeptidase n=1 Tax=Glycomyces sp. NPDC048151 TaxID=3364002 RepID=UPI00371AD63D